MRARACSLGVVGSCLDAESDARRLFDEVTCRKLL